MLSHYRAVTCRRDRRGNLSRFHRNRRALSAASANLREVYYTSEYTSDFLTRAATREDSLGFSLSFIRLIAVHK